MSCPIAFSFRCSFWPAISGTDRRRVAGNATQTSDCGNRPQYALALPHIWYLQTDSSRLCALQEKPGHMVGVP